MNNIPQWNSVPASDLFFGRSDFRSLWLLQKAAIMSCFQEDNMELLFLQKLWLPNGPTSMNLAEDILLNWEDHICIWFPKNQCLLWWITRQSVKLYATTILMKIIIFWFVYCFYSVFNHRIKSASYYNVFMPLCPLWQWPFVVLFLHFSTVLHGIWYPAHV